MMTAATITEIAPTSSPTSVLRVCETKGKGYNQQVVLYYHMLEMFQLVHNIIMILKKDFIGSQIYARMSKVVIHCTIILFLDLDPIYVVAVSVHYYKDIVYGIIVQQSQK